MGGAESKVNHIYIWWEQEKLVDLNDEDEEEEEEEDDFGE